MARNSPMAAEAALSAEPAPVLVLRPGGRPDTHALSYRDEEIVLRCRQGERAHETGRALGHPLPLVLGALCRARTLGIPTDPAPIQPGAPDAA
ncbi:hypothetical protein [Rubellimicrobium arenae]|uniref:hypothetical protein n=1 Tax=Rubellimicrobium arenae TaxID=2817372 RepID=UPI001B30C751|nr:hypothetical protein [Rubellimicrobium arenae]